MSTFKDFRVLLMDDTAEVLAHLRARLKCTVTVDKICTEFEIVPIRIETEQIGNGGVFRISDSTIKKIAEVCEKPFDYILTDFAFIGDPNKNDELRTKLIAEHRNVKPGDLVDATILQLQDVKKRFDELKAGLDSALAHQFERNFLKHTAAVTVYTNSPDPFASYFSPEALYVRELEVLEVFPDASPVVFLLMHEEFSISPAQFNSLAPDERKARFSSLLSRRIEDEVKIITLKDMVLSQSKLRVKNTNEAFKILTRFGIGFGALVALFGEIIFHFFRESLAMTFEDLEFTFSPHLHFPTADSRLLADWIAFIAVTILSVVVFPKWGVMVSKKVEDEVDKLLNPGGRD